MTVSLWELPEVVWLCQRVAVKPVLRMNTLLEVEKCLHSLLLSPSWPLSSPEFSCSKPRQKSSKEACNGGWISWLEWLPLSVQPSSFCQFFTRWRAHVCTSTSFIGKQYPSIFRIGSQIQLCADSTPVLWNILSLHTCLHVYRHICSQCGSSPGFEH